MTYMTLPIQAATDRGFTRVTLKNGLTVIYKVMKNQPQISINAIFPIGFSSEKEKGISHLHEHLVFRGGSEYSFDDIARVTIRDGGQFSGSTGFTATQYNFVVSKENFMQALKIFNDSVWNTNTSESAVALEKKIVLHELDMDYSLRYQYYPILHYLMPEFGYPEAALTYAAINSTDLQKYHRTYYQPENATYILAGDFDPLSMLSELEKISNGYGKGEDIKPEIQVFDIPAQDVEESRNIYPYHYQTMLAYEFDQMPEKDRMVLYLLSLMYGMDYKINYERNEYNYYYVFYRHLGNKNYFGIYYVERNHPFDPEQFKQQKANMLKYFREFKKIDLKQVLENLNQMVELEEAQSQESAESAAQYEVNRLIDPDFITSNNVSLFKKITVKDLERVIDQYFNQPPRTWILVKNTPSGGK